MSILNRICESNKIFKVHQILIHQTKLNGLQHASAQNIEPSTLCFGQVLHLTDVNLDWV